MNAAELFALAIGIIIISYAVFMAWQQMKFYRIAKEWSPYKKVIVIGDSSSFLSAESSPY